MDTLAKFEKPVSLAVGVLTVCGILTTLVIYFASLQPRLNSVEGELTKQVARIDERSKGQEDHLHQIDESRLVGLQRLSRVEEAVTTIKDSLTSINGKLDGALARRR